MTATPEQDHPDRLAEIKQRYSINNDTRGDFAWMIAEAEGLRARLDAVTTSVAALQGDRLGLADVAHDLLRVLSRFVAEHPDPGAEALGVISEAKDFLAISRPSVPEHFAERDVVADPDGAR